MRGTHIVNNVVDDRQDIFAASISALREMPTDHLANNTSVKVLTLGDRWILDRLSNLTVDNITVVDANGEGQWLRQQEVNPRWSRQLTWEIDSAADPENTGSTGSPIPLGEWCRRVRMSTGGTYTLNVIGSIATTDIFAPSISVVPATAATSSTRINVVGTRTVLASGTFSATTSTVTATNTQGTVTDVSITWSTYLGRHIRVTSGPVSGTVAVILKDLGGGTAMVSEWGTEAGLGTITAAPGAGVTFEIVAEPTWPIPIAPLNPLAAGALPSISTGIVVELQNFEITTAVGLPGTQFNFRGCRHLTAVPAIGDFSNINFISSAWFFSSLTSALSIQQSSAAIVLGGAVNARFRVFLNGLLRISNFVMTGSSIQSGSGAFFPGRGVVNMPTGTKFGVFDGPAGEPSLDIRRQMMFMVGGTLYGSGNTVATSVKDDGEVCVNSTLTPTLTGTTELSLEGVGTALPGLEASAGAVLPAAAALTTWAQWAAAPFTRNVINYTKGSKIISIVA